MATWLDSITSGMNSFNNTVQPFANSLGSLYQTFGGGSSRGLIPMLGSWYNQNQQKDALGDAFNSVKQYSDKSLGVLKGVYDQGIEATKPYQQAGTTGISGYQNLLSNPNNITQDPGYQFRFDQGAEALRRNLAATGMRGSGNEMLALTDYGQNTARSELDAALGRYLPMVTAGQNAVSQQSDLGRSYSYGVADINRGIADAAAGTRLGQSGATTGLLSDLIGQGGGLVKSQQDPLQQATQVAQGAKSLNPGYNTLQSLLGGGTAASSAPGMVAGLNGMAGTVGTGMAGVVGAPVAAPFVGASSSVPGMVATMDSLAGGAGFNTVIGNSAIGQAAGIGSQAGGATTAAGAGAFPAMSFGIAAAMIPALKAISGSGTSESEKIGKLLGSSEQEAGANIDRLLNGQLWTFEGRPETGNAEIIAQLVKSGVVQQNDPRLQSYLQKWGDYTGSIPSMFTRNITSGPLAPKPSLNQLLGLK